MVDERKINQRRVGNGFGKLNTFTANCFGVKHHEILWGFYCFSISRLDFCPIRSAYILLDKVGTDTLTKKQPIYLQLVVVSFLDHSP